MNSPRVRTSGSLGAVLLLCVGAVAAQSPALDRKTIVDELVLANRILANEDVLDGYGHVSVRVPGSPTRYLMSRSIAPALVTVADIVEYDLDSEAVGGASGPGYNERFIHGEIYRARPDVMSVVHCHCPEVIPFSTTSVPLRPLYHMSFFIGRGVPVFEISKVEGAKDMLVRTPQLGKALAGTLGKSSALLMRGHGAVTAAQSLQIAVAEAYYLNLNARLQLQAMQLGGDKVVYLNPQEVASTTQDYARSWDFWKSRLPKN